MFIWKKLGKVFDPTQVPGRTWMKEYAQAPATLILDDAVRVYFSCRPLRESSGMTVSYTGYVDLSRQDLFSILRVASQPVLPLGEVGSFDEFGTMPFSILPHGSKVLAYYGGWTRCESVPFNISIGMAESTDGGETFTKAGAGPVLSFTPDEPFLIGVPRIRRFNKRYYLWYTAGKRWHVVDGKPEAIYKIRMAESTDGVNWHRQNKDIIPDVLGKDEAQASADVFFYKDIYHMFFCYRYTSDFRTNKKKSYRIGYAWSRDLVHWQRDDAQAGIDVADTGWDSDMISFPHIFFLNRKVYMLYLGNQFGREGFGLAVLESYV